MLYHSTYLQYALLWLASATNWYILPKLYYLLITFTCSIVCVPSSCFILLAYSSCCDSNWWSLLTLPCKLYENIFLLLLPLLAGWLESQSHDGEQVQLLWFSLHYYVYSNATTKLKTIYKWLFSLLYSSSKKFDSDEMDHPPKINNLL